jgi:hypothetical protein
MAYVKWDRHGRVTVWQIGGAWLLHSVAGEDGSGLTELLDCCSPDVRYEDLPTVSLFEGDEVIVWGAVAPNSLATWALAWPGPRRSCGGSGPVVATRAVRAERSTPRTAGPGAEIGYSRPSEWSFLTRG